jgi:hypothetical protein
MSGITLNGASNMSATFTYKGVEITVDEYGIILPDEYDCDWDGERHYVCSGKYCCLRDAMDSIDGREEREIEEERRVAAARQAQEESWREAAEDAAYEDWKERRFDPKDS